MALAYLLCPTFQIVNSAGKPATGGYLEVYLAGSRTKYFCSSDFDGTRHPFQIPLDSLGSNVVLADDANRYDVYVYNRYGTLLMSRYNVSPGAGGGAGFGVLTSSDGSVTIVETANGYDLTVNIPKPSVLRAGADPLNSDGQFVFHELVRDGDKITVDDTGKIRLDQGWYHYDITVRIVWDTAAPVNKTVPLQLYTTLASDVLDFDASYAHNDTVRLSGETKIASNGSELVFGITGLEPGMGAELVDMGVHAIYVSFGEEGNYQAGEYIDISPDRVISVTGVQPQSAMTSYAPIVSLSSYVPTADFTSYSSDVNSAITSLSSDISSVGTGISSISSMVSGLTGVYLEQSASSLFAPSSLETSKMDVSGMSAYMPSGDYLTATASSLFAPSSLGTSKLDASASSSFAQASSLSGYIPTSESSKYQQTAGMTAYVPYSSVEGTGGHVTGINGSAIAGAAGHEYSGISPIVVDNTAETISIQTTGLAVDADTMSAWVSGDDVVIGVKPGAFTDSATVSAIASGYATGKQDVSGMSAYAYESSNSAKLDKTAQVVTATATQLYAGTAYLTGVNGAPVSASRAGQAANASLATSAYYDGTGRLISSLPDSAAVSSIASSYATGKVDKSSISAQSANWNSVYNTVNMNSASWTGGGTGGGAYTSPSGTIVVAGNTLEGTNSAALTSASGGFYENPTLTSTVVSIGSSPLLLTYATLPSTSTGGDIVFRFTSTTYGGKLYVSGRDQEYNIYSASSELGTGLLTASVTQGPMVNQFYAWTDGVWVNAVDLVISAAPQVFVTGVAKLAWESSVSSKLDSTAFSTVSGSFLTAVPAGYATKTYVDSSVSSKLDTSAFSAASGNFLTAVPSGYATETYVDSSVSGKQDSSAMSAYLPFSAISADENSAITSINGSSIGGGTQVVTATGSGYPAMFAGISSINGSALIANKLSGAGYMIGSGDQGLYLTGTHGTAYYKANEMIINRSGYGEQVKFNLGSAGAQVYGSATGTRGAFIQMSNDSHAAFLGALSGEDAKIELDGQTINSASIAGWNSALNTVSSNSATWGAKPETTETFAGYWNGSALYQKIVSATMAIGTAVTTTNIATPTSNNAWIDQANSYIIHNGFSWGANWYLSSNRFMACWFNSTAGSISWRGVDAALTGKTATAYITIKYTK